MSLGSNKNRDTVMYGCIIALDLKEMTNDEFFVSQIVATDQIIYNNPHG